MQKLICNFTYIHNNGYCIIYFKCDIFAAFCSNRYCMKIVVFHFNPFLHLSQDENRFMINIAWIQICFRDRYDVHQICLSCAAWGGFSATGAGGVVSSALYGAECWLQRTQSGHTKLSGGHQLQQSINCLHFYTVPYAHHFQL